MYPSICGLVPSLVPAKLNILSEVFKPSDVKYDEDLVIITLEEYELLTSLKEARDEGNKHLKGYIFDSLVFRFKEALERGTNVRAQKLIDLGQTKGEAFIKATKENQRDEMRFIQILNEVIGEHD